MEPSTAGPSGKAKKRRQREQRSYDVDVPLVDGTYVYNFREMIKAKYGEDPNPSDDDDEDLDDDARWVKQKAKEMEEKYGRMKRKCGIGRAEMLRAELGFGYDTEDPFIDDSEPYDEMLPPNLEPEHGGFYVNEGPVVLKELDRSARSVGGSPSHSSAAGTPTAQRKRVISDSDDDGAMKRTTPKKQKKHNGIPYIDLTGSTPRPLKEATASVKAAAKLKRRSLQGVKKRHLPFAGDNHRVKHEPVPAIRAVSADPAAVRTDGNRPSLSDQIAEKTLADVVAATASEQPSNDVTTQPARMTGQPPLPTRAVALAQLPAHLREWVLAFRKRVGPDGTIGNTRVKWTPEILAEIQRKVDEVKAERRELRRLFVQALADALLVQRTTLAQKLRGGADPPRPPASSSAGAVKQSESERRTDSCTPTIAAVPPAAGSSTSQVAEEAKRPASTAPPSSAEAVPPKKAAQHTTGRYGPRNRAERDQVAIAVEVVSASLADPKLKKVLADIFKMFCEGVFKWSDDIEMGLAGIVRECHRVAKLNVEDVSQMLMLLADIKDESVLLKILEKHANVHQPSTSHQSEATGVAATVVAQAPSTQTQKCTGHAPTPAVQIQESASLAQKPGGHALAPALHKPAGQQPKPSGQTPSSSPAVQKPVGQAQKPAGAAPTTSNHQTNKPSGQAPKQSSQAQLATGATQKASGGCADDDVVILKAKVQQQQQECKRPSSAQSDVIVLANDVAPTKGQGKTAGASTAGRTASGAAQMSSAAKRTQPTSCSASGLPANIQNDLEHAYRQRIAEVVQPHLGAIRAAKQWTDDAIMAALQVGADVLQLPGGDVLFKEVIVKVMNEMYPVSYDFLMERLNGLNAQLSMADQIAAVMLTDPQLLNVLAETSVASTSLPTGVAPSPQFVQSTSLPPSTTVPGTSPRTNAATTAARSGTVTTTPSSRLAPASGAAAPRHGTGQSSAGAHRVLYSSAANLGRSSSKPPPVPSNKPSHGSTVPASYQPFTVTTKPRQSQQAAGRQSGHPLGYARPTAPAHSSQFIQSSPLNLSPMSQRGTPTTPTTPTAAAIPRDVVPGAHRITVEQSTYSTAADDCCEPVLPSRPHQAQPQPQQRQQQQHQQRYVASQSQYHRQQPAQHGYHFK